MNEQVAHFHESLLHACLDLYGDRLVTLAIFGSWARDTATPASDIDVLLIADDLPPSRGKRMRQFETIDLATLHARQHLWGPPHPPPELSPMFRTPFEMQSGSPLFLDMTDWVVFLLDRNDLFRRYLDGLRERMRQNGTERRQAQGGTYWVYKPDLQPGEVVSL